MIYLDNAATTVPKPPQVIEAVAKAMTSMGNAGRGAHAPTLAAARVIFQARLQLAELLGAQDPARIVLTANATEALNIVLQGFFSGGGHVITTAAEHNSVLRPLYLMQRRGVEITFIGVDSNGILDYAAVEKSVRPDTKAIVALHASNVTGMLTDMARLASVAKKHRLAFIVDAAQTVGALPVNVQELGADILCFTGHKGLLGPQGTGGFYLRPGLELPVFKAGGSGVQSFSKEQPRQMPEHLEAGTMNAHGIAGLSAALELIKKIGVEEIHAKEAALAQRFAEQVGSVANVRLYGDFNGERTGIVSLNIGALSSALVSDILWEEYKICVRGGVHCAPLLHRALGTERQGAVRFSFSYFNTEREADCAARAVSEIARQYG